MPKPQPNPTLTTPAKYILACCEVLHFTMRPYARLVPPEHQETAKFSHLRLRLAPDAHGEELWQWLCKGDTSKLFFRSVVAPHQGKSIHWGQFLGEHWLSPVLASIPCLETTAPNPEHVTGLDAVIMFVPGLVATTYVEPPAPGVPKLILQGNFLAEQKFFGTPQPAALDAGTPTPATTTH